MIMDKMLDGKKKRRLRKAYNDFWVFCVACYNIKADHSTKEIDQLQEDIQIQFDHFVEQIKEAYDVCD